MIYQLNLLSNEYERQAIERIRKFARLAEKMGYEPVVGFSGGKDSQVVYDLCKRAGIKFKAKFNHCFESSETLSFIKEYYPDVEWRREVKQGFFENIRVNHKGLLPTVEAAFCCTDYKHNSKYVDDASIIGVRRAESFKRSTRRVLETKNKTVLKRNRGLISGYFSDQCVASGASSEIQLKPIVDWSDDDVWRYIYKYNLPINPIYKEQKRVGCIICPKANINSNYNMLLKYPKLIDAAIKAREKSGREIDWMITRDNKDYSDNKAEYICRWLNHSFRPFTKRQRLLTDKIIENYNRMRGNK